MKKNIILILLSIVCNLSIAENWDMLKTGKLWSNLCITYDPNMTDNSLTTNFVKFEGDTLIEGKTYKLILQTEDENMVKWSLQGYVREEITEGLYLRRLNGVEEILYKYNLNVGDSIATINRFIGVPKYIIEKIDSVLINNVFRRRYTMTYDNTTSLKETWIEGIGSSKGILSSCLDVTGASFRLLCYSENEVLMYNDPEYPDCYYYTRTSIDKLISTDDTISVYPNYSQDNITISSTKYKQLRVYNANGFLFDTLDLGTQTVIILNIINYPKGLYFVSPVSSFCDSQRFVKI